MRKLVLGMLLGATAAAVTLFPSTGRTYPVSIDYSKYSCGDFVYMPPGQQKIFAGWLSGWYSQKTSTTVFDFTRFQTNLASVTDWCGKKGNIKDLLMGVLDRSMKSPAPAPSNLGGKTMDMAQIKCSDYLSDPDPSNQKFIAAWMSGYYSSQINRTEVRWAGFEGNVQSVWKYCQKHKAETIMNVITNSNQVRVF